MLSTIDCPEDSLITALGTLPPSRSSPEDEVVIQAVIESMASSLVSPDNGSPTPFTEKCLGSIDRYQLLGLIKPGGMGVLYKAFDPMLGRYVAIKILQAGQSVTRFKREARASGGLPSNEHFVVATDYREHEGRHCIVMQYVDGQDLSTIVSRHARLSVRNACEVVRQVAVALQYAYEHELVHRDIKPGNLMLTRTGTIKVLDWGLALPHESEELTIGTLGTPDYTAPEQVLNAHEVDIRADIYSLGCTLYKLLTGHVPYGPPEYKHTEAKQKAHVSAPIPSIAKYRADVAQALVLVVNRMLEKDPAKRYATPADVIDAIAPFAAGAELAQLLDTERLAPTDAGGHELADHDAASPLSFRHRDSVLPLPRSSAGHTTSGPSRKWIFAMLAIGGALLLGTVILVIRDRDGKERARLALNPGDTLAIESAAGGSAARNGDGDLEVVSNQPAFHVFVDGKSVVSADELREKTNVVVSLPRGAKTLRVSKPGFQAASTEFDLSVIRSPLNISWERLVTNDRQFTEWVIADKGGAVVLRDDDTVYNDTARLPKKDFKLHKLLLNGVDLRDADAVKFSALSSLQGLDLSNNPRLSDEGLAKILARSPKVYWLFLGGTNLETKALEAVGAMSTLQFLDISSTRVTDDALAHVASLSNLTAIHMSDTDVSDAGVHHLRPLTGLAELRAVSTRVTPAGAETLRKSLPNCKVVLDPTMPAVLNERQFAEWAIREKGRSVGLHYHTGPFDDVAKLPKDLFMIQTASLANARLQDKDAEKFSALVALQYLYLSHNHDLTDSGIADILARSPQLVALWLVDTGLSDKGLEAIGKAKMKKLGFLDIRSTEITDEGLKHLAGVPSLENLWLSETRVSDAGLLHLRELKKLTELHVKATRVTQEGAEIFRKEVPNCKVVLEGQP